MVMRKLTDAQKREALKTLYGNVMSDMMHMIKNDVRVPGDIRIRAEAIQKKWDAVSPHTPVNPIVFLELEKRLK